MNCAGEHLCLHNVNLGLKEVFNIKQNEDMDQRDLQYLNIPSLQERPVTLGEILLREGGLTDEEEMEVRENLPPRHMGRTMSPTRGLGPLASGRPRRPRGRMTMLPSTSTSAGPSEDNQDETQQPQHRHPRPLSNLLSVASSSRWRNAEARIRNFHTLMNGSRADRRGSSAGTTPRQRSLGRSDSPDLFFNPFSWQRRSGRVRQTRLRSASNFNTRSRQGRSQRIRSSISRTSRMVDIYDSRGVNRPSPYLRLTRRLLRRAHSAGAGGSLSDIPESLVHFIDFTAEFIPVERPDPDAEPPEWSLNITAADFGPFAVGRSPLSRARSLAIAGALSQVNNRRPNESPANQPEEPIGNEKN